MRFLGNKPSKRGSAGAAKRKLLEKSGLEEFSPARRFLIASVVAAEAGMMGLNSFTDVDLPARRDGKNKPTDKHPSHPE